MYQNQTHSISGSDHIVNVNDPNPPRSCDNNNNNNNNSNISHEMIRHGKRRNSSKMGIFSLPRVDMVVQGQQIKNALNRSYCSPHHSPRNRNNNRTNTYSLSHSKTSSQEVINRNRKLSTSSANANNKNNNNNVTNKTNESTIDSASQSQSSAIGSSPYTTKVHTLTISELEKLFRTDIETGLDPAYAEQLLKDIGPNVLTPPEKDSELVKWMKHVFLGVFNILLWVASFAQVSFYFLFPQNRDKLDLLVPFILAIVVLSAGTFQWYQERHSEQIMESFANMAPAQVTVIRGGQTKQIEAWELVPGDVVILTAGVKLPADIRLIETTSDMQVDNSSLTGESEPQPRSINCTSKNPMETENIGFFGTLLLKGKGKAIVYSTGDLTLLGKIAALAGKSKQEKTTFTKEVEHFVSMIAWVAVLIGVFCMIYDIAYENNFKQSLYSSICIIIANIPEGLIPAVTLALTLSAKRMSKRNVLVRNLESIETLGCVSVICSDKTGTITCGIMTVSHIYKLNIDDNSDNVDSNEKENNNDNNLITYQPRQLRSQYSNDNDILTKKLMNAAILCNNSTISMNEDNIDNSNNNSTSDSNNNNNNNFSINGFPTETGIFRASIPVLGNIDKVSQLRKDYPIVFEIPFNSDNKWHLTIHKYPKYMNKSGYLMQIKGAPEKIIDLCKNSYSMQNNNNKIELTDNIKTKILSNVENAAKLGERVLCFAEAHIEFNNNNMDINNINNNNDFNFKGDHFDSANWLINGQRGGYGELTFIGFMSLIDPPRKGVKAAINQCYQAGIKVVMVTGDYQVTAEAIAKQVGIIRPTNISVPNSMEINIHNDQNSSDIDNVNKLDNIDNNKQYKNYRVVTGSEINEILEYKEDCNSNTGDKNSNNSEIFDQFWDNILLNYDCLVFARTTPMHKMLIVEQFQKRGMIVAVTGDGVNDAPALNTANVGIAMGKNGTDVAREASDIILIDDNFTSIVAAIEEGRLITDNIKKCIAYTLCSKLPQLAPILARNWFGIPLAMTMMQVLLIDLGTDIWTGVFMAYEKKEDDIMKRQPRDIKKQPMVTWKLMLYSYLHIGVLQTLGCFLAYQQIMYNQGNGVNFIDFIEMDTNQWNKWGAGQLVTTVNAIDQTNINNINSIGNDNNLIDSTTGSGVVNNIDSNKNDGSITAGGGASDYSETLFCYSMPNECEFSDTVDYTKLYHHHLTSPQQKILLKRAQTGFYISLIIMQICAAICCQTRLASIFTHGFQNKYLNVTLIFEILFGIAVVYVTTFQNLFETESLEPACWFAVAPFAILMIIIEEVRKYYARKYPNGWVRQTLVW